MYHTTSQNYLSLPLEREDFGKLALSLTNYNRRRNENVRISSNILVEWPAGTGGFQQNHAQTPADTQRYCRKNVVHLSVPVATSRSSFRRLSGVRFASSTRQRRILTALLHLQRSCLGRHVCCPVDTHTQRCPLACGGFSANFFFFNPPAATSIHGMVTSARVTPTRSAGPYFAPFARTRTDDPP